MTRLLIVSLLLSLFANAFAQRVPPVRAANGLPAGYWPVAKSQPIIDKTQTIRLAPDLSHLREGERSAVAKLLEVGKIFQTLYETQRHPEAISAFHELAQLNKRTGASVATRNLLTLYRLNCHDSGKQARALSAGRPGAAGEERVSVGRKKGGY
jgi:hypothetical protein